MAGDRRGCTREPCGSTSCGRGPPCLPRGSLHKPSCAGPRLPSRLASAPACLPHWLLPPTRGWHPCSQSCSLDCVSITKGLAGGRPDTRARPPIAGRPLLLPHFAADSSPKQNRLSPFPPSGSSSLACGCLLRLQTAPAREGGAWASPVGTGTVRLAPGPLSALSVAGERALPRQSPDDDAPAPVQRCLLGE